MRLRAFIHMYSASTEIFYEIESGYLRRKNQRNCPQPGWLPDGIETVAGRQFGCPCVHLCETDVRNGTDCNPSQAYRCNEHHADTGHRTTAVFRQPAVRVSIIRFPTAVRVSILRFSTAVRASSFSGSRASAPPTVDSATAHAPSSSWHPNKPSDPCDSRRNTDSR